MKISAGTLLHLRVSGKLPFTKIGRIVYFSREDIRRILGSGTPDTAVVKRLFRGEANVEWVLIIFPVGIVYRADDDITYRNVVKYFRLHTPVFK